MSSSYLLVRASGPHFRIRVPESLWGVFRRKELRRSLSHLSLRQARLEALSKATRARAFFEWVSMAGKAYSAEDLERIVDDWLRAELGREVEEYRVARSNGQPLPNPELADRELLQTLSGVAGELFSDRLRSTGSGSVAAGYRAYTAHAKEVAEASGVPLEELDDTQRERFIRLVALADQRRYSLLARHSPGFPTDFWKSGRPVPGGAGGAPMGGGEGQAPAAHHPPPPSLKEAWALCVKELSERGKKEWREDRSADGKRRNHQADWVRVDLFELWGEDTPISQIDHEAVSLYRYCVLNKYPRRRKNPGSPYASLSLRELAEGPDIPEDDRIQGESLTVRLRIARAFMAFLSGYTATSRYVDGGLADALDVSSGGAVQESYQPWEDHEIDTILRSRELHTRFLGHASTRHPAGLFWLLTTLLYTGARRDEIMGLRFEDIVLDHEYPHIYIEPHEHRPKIKTDVSKRWVPLHDHVLRLGFADWVAFRKKRGQDPTLWPTGGRKSDYWGRVFREQVSQRLGLYVYRKKVMHSFRGSFISAAALVMDETPRRLVTGHKGRGTAERHYIRQREKPLAEYSRQLNLIEFGLDLGALEELWRASLMD